MNQRSELTPSPPNGVAKGIGELTHDTMALAELQLELLKIDGRDALKRMRIPATLLLLAGIVALGSVPVALLVIAEVLASTSGLSQTAALSIAAGSGFIVAAVMGLAGRFYLRGIWPAFDRSREEMTRNLAWIKQVLKQKTPLDAEQSQKR